MATEQRIPGLGNGVLQDILFKSRIHPKRRLATLGDAELGRMYSSVKSTLRDMADRGGRDTEKDLLGKPGGYKTLLSKNTFAEPCPGCGGAIVKEAYLGGAVYYCPVGHAKKPPKKGRLFRCMSVPMRRLACCGGFYSGTPGFIPNMLVAGLFGR